MKICLGGPRRKGGPGDPGTSAQPRPLGGCEMQKPLPSSREFHRRREVALATHRRENRSSEGAVSQVNFKASHSQAQSRRDNVRTILG